MACSCIISLIGGRSIFVDKNLLIQKDIMSYLGCSIHFTLSTISIFCKKLMGMPIRPGSDDWWNTWNTMIPTNDDEFTVVHTKIYNSQKFNPIIT